MITFQAYLRQKGIDTGLQTVLTDLAAIFLEISGALDSRSEGYAGSENIYGDRQVKMDLISNDFFVDHLRKNEAVLLMGSEELKEPIIKNKSRNSAVSRKAVKKESKTAGFSVVFDPLDGSSIVDTNLAVGTIVGVYRGGELLGRKGKEQVAAVVAVYGPKLTFLITTGDGVDEFLYDRSSRTFVLFHEKIRMNVTGKIYAPGNLKASVSESWYAELLKDWIKGGYSLRYSGGMVPDVNQILKKGGGIFVYPGSKSAPDGKLRLLYECAPVAYIIEQAGGKAHSGEKDILDVTIESYQQQSPFFCGAVKEVEKALQHLKGR